jgi:hypothetical protein
VFTALKNLFSVFWLGPVNAESATRVRETVLPLLLDGFRALHAVSSAVVRWWQGCVTWGCRRVLMSLG